MNDPFALFLLFAAAALLSMPAWIRLLFRIPSNPEKSDPGAMGLPFQTVSIPTVLKKNLFGWFLPFTDAPATIVILHGWGSNAEEMLPLALPFHRAGINVLLIDARNHGRSDRDSFSSLPKFAEDTEKALEWLKRTHPASSRNIALLGHSLGAGAVLLAASRREDINAVISISAFAHPEWMMRRYLKQLHLPAFLIPPILRYVEWVIGYRYQEIAPIHTLCRIHSPVLLVHGEEDRTVPIEDALAIERKCRHRNVQLLRVEGADHESVEKINEHVEPCRTRVRSGRWNHRKRRGQIRGDAASRCRDFRSSRRSDDCPHCTGPGERKSRQR